jgi:hypothetical protein
MCPTLLKTTLVSLLRFLSIFYLFVSVFLYISASLSSVFVSFDYVSLCLSVTLPLHFSVSLVLGLSVSFAPLSLSLCFFCLFVSVALFLLPLCLCLFVSFASLSLSLCFFCLFVSVSLFLLLCVSLSLFNSASMFMYLSLSFVSSSPYLRITAYLTFYLIISLCYSLPLIYLGNNLFEHLFRMLGHQPRRRAKRRRRRRRKRK